MKYAFALSPVLLLVAACDRQPSGEIAAPAPNQAQSATIEPTAPPPSAVPTEPVTKDSNVPAPASPAEGPSRDLALSVETQGMETRVAKIYQESVDAAKFDPESADAWGRLGMVGSVDLTILDSLLSLAVTTAASLVIARITWVLWEQPWLRLKRRFSY